MQKIKIETYAQKKEKYDVIVVGGGIAGVSASVSASREGAKVLLLEKGVNLGGLATGGLISWYEPLCDGRGNQIIKGISEELIRLACEFGCDNLPKNWGGDGACKNHTERFATAFSPMLFALSLENFVLQNGVTIRFDSLATNPVIKNGKCEGIVVESISGCEFFECDMVIDASGDASICYKAGVPTVNGKNYFTYISHAFNINDLNVAVQNNDLCNFRKWLNVGSDMLGNGHPSGVSLVQGDSCEKVTEFLIFGKKRLYNKLKTLQKNTFDITALPTIPQFRTVRRIIGNSDFCAENGKTFEDTVAVCNDFRPQGVGKTYQIPFGALWNKSVCNILTAGRIISSPQGDGWEVARVIPVCALTGECAGKIASLCVKQNKNLNDVTLEDIKKVRL